jgi:glycosyltransferase involved in cell wall biosynthesis
LLAGEKFVNTTMPQISVIIPAFNAGRFINRTIDSVLAQTFKDFELIVVDDGSTDNTGQAVKSYGSKVRYIYQPNAGDGPARNTGINAAAGKWLAFLDHDDEWLPEKLDTQMKLLSANPDLRWCGTNRYQSDGQRCAVVGDEHKSQKALGNRDYFDNFFRAVADGVCQVITSTLMIRRDVFSEVGVFDGRWKRCADQDMWWRITYKFPRIGYISRPLAIVHLEAPTMATVKLSLEGKRGEQIRELIARHLEPAKAANMAEEFRPLAAKVLKESLLTMLYRGFGSDARKTVSQFSDLFAWHWRMGTYMLTIFPNATAGILQTIIYLAHKLGLERQVSRRWVYKQEPQKKPKNN